jgi:hypothetical protein
MMAVTSFIGFGILTAAQRLWRLTRARSNEGNWPGRRLLPRTFKKRAATAQPVRDGFGSKQLCRRLARIACIPALAARRKSNRRNRGSASRARILAVPAAIVGNAIKN